MKYFVIRSDIPHFHPTTNGWLVIPNEIYTAREKTANEIPDSWGSWKEISQRRTYKMFGARREMKCNANA